MERGRPLRTIEPSIFNARWGGVVHCFHTYIKKMVGFIGWLHWLAELAVNWLSLLIECYKLVVGGADS